VRPERVELASVKKMRKKKHRRKTPSKKDDAVRVARKAKTPRVTRKEKKSRNRVPSYSSIISRRPCWNGYHGRVTPSSFAKLMPYHTAALVENA
jgi:hypothetical protein